jgi:hypothetical protein
LGVGLAFREFLTNSLVFISFTKVCVWQIVLKKSARAVFRVVDIQDAGPDLER